MTTQSNICHYGNECDTFSLLLRKNKNPLLWKCPVIQVTLLQLCYHFALFLWILLHKKSTFINNSNNNKKDNNRKFKSFGTSQFFLFSFFFSLSNEYFDLILVAVGAFPDPSCFLGRQEAFSRFFSRAVTCFGRLLGSLWLATWAAGFRTRRFTSGCLGDAGFGCRCRRLRSKKEKHLWNHGNKHIPYMHALK